MNLYRFRPFDILKGQKTVIDELRESEIFLATLEENNDPMDGVQDFYFEGDIIAWKGLLKHFMLCTYDTFCLLHLLGNEEANGFEIPRTQITPFRIGSEITNKHLLLIQDKVFSRADVKALLKYLVENGRTPASVVSLTLRVIFPLVSKAMNEVNESTGSSLRIPISENHDSPEILTGFVAELRTMDINKLTGLSVAFDTFSEQQMLKSIAQYRDQESTMSPTANRRFLEYLLKFPSVYLESLLADTTPRYWLSSFTSNPKSISMWGHYAQGHRGICLIFSVSKKPKDRNLSLNRQRYSIHRVRYKSEVTGYNYFASLWHFGLKDLDEFWLHSNGESSPLLKMYLDGEQQSLVDRIIDKVSTKLKAWSHEREYRLVKYGFSRETLPQEVRIEHYEPLALTGVIFGARTSLDCRLEIVRIMKDRRESNLLNPQFKFYQAKHFGDSQNIELLPLSLKDVGS